MATIYCEDCGIQLGENYGVMFISEGNRIMMNDHMFKKHDGKEFNRLRWDLSDTDLHRL